MTEKLKEIRKQIVGYLMAALGLIAGLAWNEAAKGLIEHIYPLDQHGLWAKFIYAIIITLVVVIVSWLLLRDTEDK